MAKRHSFSPGFDRKVGSTLRSGSRTFADATGTFMGRDALSLAASVLHLGPDDVILLPAFLCREVVKPFLGTVSVDFYDVRPDLSADPHVIETRTEDENIKAVMIINYFGFLQPFRAEIKKICRKKRIVLIEDCAHSLLTDGSGETGDLVIYSFRKLLPVPDGGALKINGVEDALAPRFYPRLYSNALSLLIIAKLLLKVRTEALSRARLTARTKNLRPHHAFYGGGSRVLPLSSFTRYGIRSLSFSRIIERRRRDYAFWLEVSRRTDIFTPLFPDLPVGVCPLGFPIRVHERDSLKLYLQRKGMTTRIHWHLPEIIGDEFTTSREISAHTLTLPIYPDLSEQQREQVEALLRSVPSMRNDRMSGIV